MSEIDFWEALAEGENPLATDLAEAFFFEVDWQNIAQVILGKLE